jgi:hypothetical protein
MPPVHPEKLRRASHVRGAAKLAFPHLRDVRFTHRWGGPFSVTLDLNPALGYVGDERAVYSLGCIGHGVSMTHLNAQALRDLLLERTTELTESPFVNRRVFPWPPEPIRHALGLVMRGYLRAEDWLKERSLRRLRNRLDAEEADVVREAEGAGV